MVTGGSQGIGKCICEEFAKNGYAVAACSRTLKDVESTASLINSAGGAAHGFPLDVSDARAVEGAVRAILKKFGRIDVLVNAAGIYGPIGRLEENNPDAWDQCIRINLCGTAFCTRAVIPAMKKQGGGSIINFAGGGVGGSNLKPAISAYTSSKFGIAGFTEVMSKGLLGDSIRINAISPGAVNTRLLDELLAAGKSAGEDFQKDAQKQKETGGTPPLLAAELALYLAGNESSHITGKVLSAVWEKKEKLNGLKGAMPASIYTLRRIDEFLFCEKKKA